MSSEQEKAIELIMARHHNDGDALIEVLHAAQQLTGYLSRPMLKKIARTLQLPPSKVLGVATFYHLFRFEPPHAHTATVCTGTACYVAGSTALAQTLREHAWTLAEGRCVGSCGLAPIVICDGVSLTRLTPERLCEALHGVR